MQNQTLKDFAFLILLVVLFVSMAWAAEGRLWAFDGMSLALVGLGLLALPLKQIWIRIRGPRYDYWVTIDSKGRELHMVLHLED